jgi:hypothetical protein
MAGAAERNTKFHKSQGSHGYRFDSSIFVLLCSSLLASAHPVSHKGPPRLNVFAPRRIALESWLEQLLDSRP